MKIVKKLIVILLKNLKKMKILTIMEIKKRKHLIFESDLTKFYDNLKLTNKSNIQFKDN